MIWLALPFLAAIWRPARYYAAALMFWLIFMAGQDGAVLAFVRPILPPTNFQEFWDRRIGLDILRMDYGHGRYVFKLGHH